MEELIATVGQETREAAEAELQKFKGAWPGCVQPRSKRKITMMCGGARAVAGTIA